MKIIDLKSIKELPLKYIYVEGSPEERGYQYGVQCKELIHKSIDVYKEIVGKQRGNITWEQISKEVKPFIKGLKIYDANLYKELVSLSEGASVTIDEIIFLSARAEIINPIWMKASIQEGCTSFFVNNSKTKNDEIFLGQTWDWSPLCSELLVLMHSKDEHGHQFLSVTEAGGIGKIGCNNHGVANLLNYLNNFEVNPGGTPYNILLRRVLDSKDTLDAQRNIMRSPIAFGLNMIIADREDFAVDYELTANGLDFFYPDNGIIVHTNHFLSNKLLTRNVNRTMYPNSINRYNIANTHLKKKDITIDDLVDLVSYHGKDNLEDNICRHRGESQYDLETAFTMIIELKKMEFYLCVGNPCCNSFYKINLQTLFNFRESIL